jgi:thiosulfate/3-mercaptopyruvate sulfurtransferase
MNRRRHLVRAPWAAALLLVVADPAAAADQLVFVDRADLEAGTRVVDARDGRACVEASLAGARCLPVAELFDGDGRPPDFRALRWLFGTIGLTGREPVLVVADRVGDAAAVGALLFLSGQARVAILDGPLAVPAGAPGGSDRSLTREAVFTAPMRDQLLAAAPDGAVIAAGQPSARLADFARRYASGEGPLLLSLAP